jgi:hypothetical protein
MGRDFQRIDARVCVGDFEEPVRPSFHRAECYTGFRRVFSSSLYSSGDRAR